MAYTNNNSGSASNERVNTNARMRRARVGELKMEQLWMGKPNGAQSGEAILSDDTPVCGLIPYGSLVLKFSWSLGKTTSKKYKGLECHTVFGYPKLDHTGSALPLKWQNLSLRKLQDPLPNEIKRTADVPIGVSHLYLNGWAFICPESLEVTLKEYDRTNQTHLYRPAWSEFNKWSRHVSEDNISGCHNEAVIYAQFARVFETLFGITFYNLQHIKPLTVFQIYCRMISEGAHKLFNPFPTTDRFEEREKNAAKKNNNNTNNNATPDANNTDFPDEEVEQEPKSNKFSDGGITLELTLAKAISIYNAQLALKVKNRPHTSLDDGEHDDIDVADEISPDDSEEPYSLSDDDVAAFIDGDSSSANSSSPTATTSRKRARPGGPVEVVNSQGIVLLSTNQRKVKLPMPDMFKIPADAWVSKLVTTHLRMRYAQNHDMCVTPDSIFEMIGEAAGEGFPVELDIDIVWRVMKDMVAKGDIGMYDAETHEVYLPGKGGALSEIDSIPPLMHIGLAHAMQQEHGTFTFLKDFINYRYADTEHTSRMGKVLAEVDTLFDPFGAIMKMNLSDEQWRAVCLAVTSPLSMISGPGGTGKTTIIKIIVRILRCAGLKGIFLFTAFKNDTVNQTKKALEVLDQGENIRHDEWCNFKRAHNLFETCDYVRCRWGSGSSSDNKTRNNDKDGSSSGSEEIDKKYQIPKTDLQDKKGRLNAEVVFFEEASLTNASHVYSVLNGVNPEKLKYIVFVGDPLQLPPMNPGEPFCNLVNALPNFCVRLAKNFRTSSQVITNNLDAIRKCDLQSLCFHDPENPEDKDGNCFIRMKALNAIKGKPRSDKTVLQTFGKELQALLVERDPERKRYSAIQSISAYNDMARYASCIYARHYFGNTTPDDDCIDFAYEKNKNCKTFKPILYLGERVVFIETDKKKGFAKGRVGYITEIFDHKKCETPTVQQNLMTRVKSTAEPMHPRTQWRTIVVDGYTNVTTYGPSSFTNILESAGCITIHRSQGAEYEEVVCLFAPGKNLAHNRVIYTAISRTKSTCHVLGTDTQIEKMLTTPAPVPTSAFSSMLRNKLNHDRINVFEILAGEFARATVTKLHPTDPANAGPSTDIWNVDDKPPTQVD